MNIFCATIPDKPDAARVSPGNNPGNISIPLYVAGAVAQLAGLTALAFQLTEPTFAYFTMLLTVIGLTCAYFLRRFGGSSRLLQGGAAIVTLAFLAALRGVGPFQNLVPFEAQGSQELLLVCALAFTATLCSFLLITDESVMFTCVWAIAIIGLTGTVNINQELIICFIVFLIAATFLLVHQNSLSGGMASVTENVLLGDGEGAKNAARPRWRLLQTQAKVAFACAAGAILLGFLIAIPLQMIGRNLSLGSVIQRLNVPPAAAQQLTGASRGAFQLNFNSGTDFQVGLGPVSDDLTERARVESPKPLYWRGRLFDYYTGKGWTNTFITAQRAPQDSEILTPVGDDDAEGLSTFRVPAVSHDRKKTETVKYRFHVQGRFQPLYVAAEARELRLASANVTLRPDNALSVPNVWSPYYEGISEIPDAKPSDLKKTRQRYPGVMQRLYLQLGEKETSLGELAEQIITDANAQNPYDKAEALRQWVSSNCVYTLDAPAVPPGRDAAEYFLRDSKEGYCDLYATAFTMLCRHAGLPARIATGFAPGVEIEDAKTRTFSLREADRHSWTEVYFDGYGWIVFDATQDTPGTMPAARTPEPQDDNRTLIERVLGAGWLPLTLTVLGAGGFMYFLVMEAGLLLRSVKVAAAPGAHSVSADARKIVRTYESASRQLGRRGVRRAAHATTTEYLQAVRRELGENVYEAFAPLTALFQRAVYAAQVAPMTPTYTAKASDALK
ncbi:MAG: hypothetical protein H7Y38_06635, partial [Armatimonadetes bacterium]|nr:hypothetical protein [Armatimonadota bacterium]